MTPMRARGSYPASDMMRIPRASDSSSSSRLWAWSGTYGAFTPLMYLPARVWSQQNQDSPFRVGVLHILVGHSGPETAADGRTHDGELNVEFGRGEVFS